MIYTVRRMNLSHLKHQMRVSDQILGYPSMPLRIFGYSVVATEMLLSDARSLTQRIGQQVLECISHRYSSLPPG